MTFFEPMMKSMVAIELNIAIGLIKQLKIDGILNEYQCDSAINEVKNTYERIEANGANKEN